MRERVGEGGRVWRGVAEKPVPRGGGGEPERIGEPGRERASERA